NNVDSNNASSRFAQCTSTNGSRLRGDRSWRSSASSYFPVPVSPSIRIGNEAFANREARRGNSWMACLSPRKDDFLIVIQAEANGLQRRSDYQAEIPTRR